MIKSIVKFSVFHPLSILSLILGLCLLGIFSLLTLKADFLPEILSEWWLADERHDSAGSRIEGVVGVARW